MAQEVAAAADRAEALGHPSLPIQHKRANGACQQMRATDRRKALLCRCVSADMRYLFALFAALAISACSQDASDTPPADVSNVVKVAAYKNGRITLDGRPVSIEEIRETFADLSRNNGAVWYYREAADAEPHPNATLVVETIIDARLPISLSTKPDFSDVVLPDGTTKPR